MTAATEIRGRVLDKFLYADVTPEYVAHPGDCRAPEPGREARVLAHERRVQSGREWKASPRGRPGQSCIKITPDVAREIQAAHSATFPPLSIREKALILGPLALEHGVTRKSIRNIIYRRTWANGKDGGGAP